MQLKLPLSIVAALAVLTLSVFSFSQAFVVGTADASWFKGPGPYSPLIQPLTSPRRLSSPFLTCLEARRNYAREQAKILAIAISTHLSPERLMQRLAALENYVNQVCGNPPRIPQRP